MKLKVLLIPYHYYHECSQKQKSIGQLFFNSPETTVDIRQDYLMSLILFRVEEKKELPNSAEICHYLLQQAYIEYVFTEHIWCNGKRVRYPFFVTKLQTALAPQKFVNSWLYRKDSLALTAP